MMAVFREAEPNDVTALLAMMSELYANDGVPFDDDRSRRAALQLIEEREAGCIWVIEAERTIAGYLVLTFGFSLEFGGRHGFIDELFITASYRGHGLGAAAVHHAKSECARLYMTNVLLEADLANKKATRFYRRLGFHEHPRRLMCSRVNVNYQDETQD